MLGPPNPPSGTGTRPGPVNTHGFLSALQKDTLGGGASEREDQGVGRVGRFGPTGWEIHKARAGRGGEG